jgi:hypothetical protein
MLLVVKNCSEYTEYRSTTPEHADSSTPEGSVKMLKIFCFFRSRVGPSFTGPSSYSVLYASFDLKFSVVGRHLTSTRTRGYSVLTILLLFLECEFVDISRPQLKQQKTRQQNTALALNKQSPRLNYYDGNIMDHPDDHAEAAPAQVLGDEHQNRSDHGLHGEDTSLRLTGQEQNYAANNDIIISITDALEAQESLRTLGEVMLHQDTVLRLTGNGEEQDRKRKPTQEKDCGNDSIDIVTNTLGERESPLALQNYFPRAIMQGSLPEIASNDVTVALPRTGLEQNYAANNGIINSITDALEAQESLRTLGEVMLHQDTVLRLTGNGEEQYRKCEPTQEKDCGNDSIDIVANTLGEQESPLELQIFFSSQSVLEDSEGSLPEIANDTTECLDGRIGCGILEKESPELLPLTQTQRVSISPAQIGPSLVAGYPGAVAVAGFGMPPEQPDAFSIVSFELTDSADQHETPLFNATLVEESSAALIFAHATAMDAEADENVLLQRLHSVMRQQLNAEAKEYSHRWRQIVLKAMVAVIVVSSIAVIVMAATGVFAPPYEERPTEVPSMVPSLSPAPSATLLTFLAERSFDGGKALATVGSAQQRAGEWLEGELSLLGQSAGVEYNYRLVQTYALATLYYATSGNEWDTTRSWLLGIDSCTAGWIGLFCNMDGEVTSFKIPNKFSNGEIFPEKNFSTTEKSFLIPAEIGLISTLGTWKAATHSRNMQYRSRRCFSSCYSLCTSVAI